MSELKRLKGGVYDAEDVIENVRDYENSNSANNSEYTDADEEESTEALGALPDNYKIRKY